MSQAPPPPPGIARGSTLPARHSIPIGALLMALGGAVGIGASSAAWWSVTFDLRSQGDLTASLGGLAGVATTAGRVAAVASMVALIAAAASLGTLRAGLRRRLGILAVCVAVVVVSTAAYMMLRGSQVAADRADLAARAQDLSEATDLSEIAQEFAPGARLSLDARLTPALMVLMVSGMAVGVGGSLLVVDPLGTRRRGAGS